MRTITPIAVLSLLTAPAAQSWTSVNPTQTHPSISDHAAAYDIVNAEVMTFGRLGQTWTYDGTTWTQRTPTTSPPARIGAPMAADTVRGVTVLFGGNQVGAPNRFDDTWEWNGIDWSQRSPTTRPPRRLRHAMTYDEQRGRTVMYGGIDSPASAMSDTWEWDGTDWIPVTTATSPGPREWPAMAYDANRGVAVMFGGWNPRAGSYQTGTWEYDGSDWTRIDTAHEPQSRQFHRMCFDLNTGYIVLQAGFNAGLLADTWLYDGFDWVEVSGAAGPATAQYALAFDIGRGVAVCDGGVAGFGSQTWEFAGDFVGVVSAFGAGCAGTAGIPTLGQTAGSPVPALGQLVGIEANNLPLASGGTTFALGLRPLAAPLDLSAIGMDNGCSLLVPFDLSFFAASGGSSAATANIQIPTNPFWSGRAIWLQAFTLDTGANTLGVTASDGVRVRIGA